MSFGGGLHPEFRLSSIALKCKPQFFSIQAETEVYLRQDIPKSRKHKARLLLRPKTFHSIKKGIRHRPTISRTAFKMLFIKIFPANEPALRPELGCKPNKNITDLDARIGNSYRTIRYAPYFCSLTGR